MRILLRFLSFHSFCLDVEARNFKRNESPDGMEINPSQRRWKPISPAHKSSLGIANWKHRHQNWITFVSQQPRTPAAHNSHRANWIIPKRRRFRSTWGGGVEIFTSRISRHKYRIFMNFALGCKAVTVWAWEGWEYNQKCSINIAERWYTFSQFTAIPRSIARTTAFDGRVKIAK